MLKTIALWTILLIVCVASSNTYKKEIVFVKSNNVASYFKNLPKNAYNAFKGSLHAVEFDDQFMNIFMKDFLNVLEKSPETITNNIKSAEKNIANSFGKLRKSFVKTISKYDNISKYINSTLLLSYHVGNYCNMTYKNITLDDINNCSPKILTSLNESKNSNEIKAIIHTITSALNSKISRSTMPYIFEFAQLKLLSNSILKDSQKIILKELIELFKILSKSPTYLTFCTQIYYATKRVMRNFNAYILPTSVEIITTELFNNAVPNYFKTNEDNFKIMMEFVDQSTTLKKLNKLNILAINAIHEKYNNTH